MGNTWDIEQDTRWKHVLAHVKDGDAKQLRDDILKAPNPRDMVRMVYYVTVNAYDKGRVDEDLAGRRAA